VTCDICRGDGYVRLPIHRSVVVSYAVSEPSPVEASYQEFPCPQCGPKTVAQVHVFESVATVTLEIDHYAEEAKPYIRDNGLHEIVHKIHDAGMVTAEQGPEDTRLGTRAYRFTVGVVSPEVVRDIKAEKKAAEDEFAGLVVEMAIRKIHGWDEYLLSKDFAEAIIRDALQRAQQEREKL